MRAGGMRLHKRLGFESLETREMLSGVAAALDHGVLTVDGVHDSSVAIHVWRQGSQIRIDGVVGTFAAAQVRSIVVDCGADGSQVVALGINQTSAQAALGRPVTVNSGTGSATVQIGTTNVYFAGAAHKLGVSASGAMLLDGVKPDWFDTHVADASLRSLAKTLYSDRVLGRSDMLAIFQDAALETTISATEVADLRAIAGNTALFTGVTYVQNLAEKVVTANPANAKYQGGDLGNLAAGDSADHLDKLVDKWFLGTDHPNAKVGGTTYAYALAQALLFPYTPVYTDVRQGYVGDCYLLAGLADTAMYNRGAIQSMFIVNGDGTYTVRFYNGRLADYVTVDAYVPADNGNYVFANQGQSLADKTVALWVPLAEKAYAQVNEEGWLRTKAENSYASISNGWPNDVYAEVTGKATPSSVTLATTTDYKQLVSAYKSGRLVWLVSNTKTTDPLIGDNHVYAVMGYDAKRDSVLVYNPWGINNGSNKPGLQWLTRAQVLGNFRAWCRS
jgi:hypothetical protein